MAVPVIANAASSGTCGMNGANVTWTLDNEGTLTISGKGNMADYKNSSSVPWYNNSSSITKVVIDQGIISIGDFAFSNCISLTNVTIPDSVTGIGDDAFSGCSNLDSVYISELKAYLNIDYSNEYSNPMRYAYKMYINGKRIAGTVTIPTDITKIPDYAFHGCDGITSITIPESITAIGGNAFSGCSMCNIYYNSNHKDFTNILKGIDGASDSVLYCSDLTATNWGKCGDGLAWFFDTENTLIISGTGDMEDYGFRDNPWMKLHTEKVIIETGITKIGSYAFRSCDFTNVTIPDSVITIGDSAFRDCHSLTSAVIGNGVTSIDYYTFAYCSRLTSITIGTGVSSIHKQAFYDCYVRNIYISDLTKWCTYSKPFDYYYTLYINNVLVTDLLIPNNVTNISNSAFSYCASLTNVNIPDSVTSIGDEAFSYCSNLACVTIGTGLENIGSYIYSGCNKLTTVNYNASKVLSNIFNCDGNYSNYYNNILLIVLGDNVNSIETNAFENSTHLKRIIIPKCVTEIERAAFQYCTSLTTVDYGGSEADWNEIYIGAENGNLKNAEIHYNSPLFATENIILTSPTVTSVEDETTRTFTVEIEQPVIGSYVYAVTYDANGMPLNISKVPLNLFEPTAVVVDKSDNDNYAKIFVWTDAMQPLTYVKSIELQ